MKKYSRMIGNILVYGGVYIGLQFFVSFMFLATYSFVGAFINGSVSDNIISMESQAFLAQNINIILITSTIISLIIYIAIFRYKNQDFFKFCGFSKISVKNILLIILMGIGMNIMVDSILSYFPIEEIFPEYKDVVESLVGGGQSSIIILLSVGILIPIFEEMLFRGLIFNELRKGSHIIFAIITQAVLFGIFHGNILQGIYASILGVILALVYLWTGSLWASVVAHVIFNTTSLFYSLINQLQNQLILMVVGFIMFVLPLVFIYRGKSNQNR
jgi:uncharacterized protein